MPVRHDREFWKRACRELRRGGSLSDVARRHDVKPGTLQWWKWKFRRESSGEAAEFLPVVVSEGAPATSGALLELETNGVRIRAEIGVDVQYVAALVAAIRSAC